MRALSDDEFYDIIVDTADYVAKQVAATVAHGVKASTVKSVARMADEFSVRLSEVVASFFNGDSTAADVARVMRQLIKSFAMDEYQEGMTEGGIDDPEGELSDEDESTVSNWVTEQLGYVADFVQAMKDTRKAEDTGAVQDAQSAINARVELWRGSMENLGSLGKASARKNALVTWHYGDTDHCDTCAKLNGKRHRLKWFLDNGYIPQENGSETLDCHGFHCQCTLDDDEGKQVMP